MNTCSCYHAVWTCVGIALALPASSTRGAPPVIDTRSTVSSTTVTSDELERIPQGRDPRDILTLAPGLRPDSGTSPRSEGGGFSGAATIPVGDSLSGWYLEPIFGVQTGSVDVTQFGGPIVRDHALFTLSSGSTGVINLGLSRNREFRDRPREEVPNQTVSFDPKRGRLLVDPRSFFEIEYQQERRLTRSEKLEELNEVYRLQIDSAFRQVGPHDSSDTGGFGGLGVGRYFSLKGYEPARLQGGFFYDEDRPGSWIEPFVHTGVLVTGTSLDFSTGPNVTAWETVSTFYTRDYIQQALDRDPGEIFQTNLWRTQQTFVDLDTYKLAANLGVGVRCRCGLELGVNLQPGIRIDDFDGREIKRTYLEGHKVGERTHDASSSEVNFYLGLEGKLGYPLGRFGYLKAAVGTQIAGDTPEFRVGRSRVSVSNDPGDNVYGSLSLSIPFEVVFGGR